jgi:hypothetical protein
MAKLRHIAIAAEDPYATADFYKQAGAKIQAATQRLVNRNSA